MLPERARVFIVGLFVLFCFVFGRAAWHSVWDLSSPTRDGTHAPHWKHGVLTPGPPGKSLRPSV